MSGPGPEIMQMARAEAGDSLERIEQTLLALESGSAAPDAIDSLFRDAHSIKGTASMVGWAQAAAIAHVMEDRLEACRDTGAFPAELADPMLRATDALRRAVDGDGHHDGDAAGVAGVIDALGSAALPAPASMAAAARSVPPPAVRPAARTAGAVENRAIRVPAEKIDRMLDAVGETVLNHRRLDHELGERIRSSGEDLAREQLDRGERLLEELQDSVIEMRTLPLSSITAAFPRAVRDMAVTEGKHVELVIVGAETQLDRVILEGISETITHLLRNAVAHGIEHPDTRVAAGKPPTARIELRAQQLGGMVSIEVSDDGRGVSAELLARAGQSESLTDLLTAPGFSTAEAVSTLAGRGVGLDAVRTHVERLGGSLEVRSEPGAGAEVILLLPMTLALLRVLVCERGGQRYGVPLASVREVVAVSETVTMGGHPLLALRGESVALADLAVLIGAAAPPLPPRPAAIVLALAGRVAAVACDRVLGDQEVVMKSLGPLLREVPGYLGATIMEDGHVALALDPTHLLKMHAARSPAAPIAETDQRASPNVLVVDDQFTVRELQRSILETAGYRVETARDGREALARIGHDPQVDMVLTDVQMPEMDGFELLRAIRRQREHASLPVVIVSSLGGDEDRRRGVEEGADAYIVKDEFDQRTLLDTVGRLVGR